MKFFDFGPFFRLTVNIALLGAGLPAAIAAVPELAAAMTVYDGAASRELDIKLRTDSRMTVFSADGRRQVAIDDAWPEQPTRNGWLALSAGYRRDNMRFNIGAAGGPNILSELEWQVPAVQIRADGGWTHASGATIRGYLAYARSDAKGLDRDSDYALDNRQAEFSRSYADTTGSEMFDALLGFGWQLPLGEHFTLTPLLGLARFESVYRSSNGRQAVSDSANAALLGIAWSMPLGPFAGLQSRYNPVWTTFWQGVEVEARPVERFTLRGGVKHHWFKYRAEADWNLRSDFAHPVSFRQTDSGRGWEAEIEAALKVGHGHRIALLAGKRTFKTRDGNDTTFFYDGTNSTINLGETVLSNWSVHASYRYEF